MQRMKGQTNNQVSNGPKDHQQQTEHGEDGGFDSWRSGNATQHHSSYPINTGDLYNHYYPGTSFSYQAFGAGDGTWSNGTDPVAFLSGYGGQMGHDAYGMDGMFSANTGGGFNTFGQPAFNYFPGNGDYSAWGTPRKARYEDYYHRGDAAYQSSADVKSIEQNVQGLSISDGSHRQDGASLQSQPKPEPKEPRKITWASVASQPAKPVPPLSSTQGMKKKAGMPPPPIVPGKHNMDIGTWGEGKSSSNPPPPKAPPPPIVQPPVLPPPQPLVQQRQRAPQAGQAVGPGVGAPAWNRRPISPPMTQAQAPIPNAPAHVSQPSPQQQQQPQVQAPASMQQQQPPPPPTNQPPSPHPNQRHPPPPSISQQQYLPPQQPSSPSHNVSHPVLDELKIKNDYNPMDFDQTAPGARFFVIKSYSEDDIHRSIKYEIWCSTEHGNKRLDQAYREVSRDGAPLYLFFSVNGSGHFCGMAQMVSSVDYQSNSSVWSQDKWKGQFRVRWIYVKDVPNVHLRHIKLENNENKPVTNSRDAQEVPHAKGVQVLRIMHSYRHSTSIFDDFGHYEQRQAEEDQRKAPINPIPHHHHPPPPSNHRGGSGGRPYPPEHLSRNREPHQYSHPHSGRDHHQRRERDSRDNRGRGRGGSRQ